MDRLLTQADVAELLGVTERCIEGWRVRGGGPRYVRCGRLARYRREDVERWIASRTATSTSDPGPAPDRAA